MPRPKRGSIWRDKAGQIYARITFTEDDGRRRDYKRKADGVTHAWELAEEMLGELKTKGRESLDAHRMTFAEFAKYYKETYVTEPQYRQGRKISGLRGWRQQKGMVDMLAAKFGQRRVRDITYSDIRRFRDERLATKVVRAKNPETGERIFSDRTITTVNRELALLRRMFSVAETHSWIHRNPFKSGDSLISSADEKQRERILSKDEEALLLASCTGRREHLRAILICALDTAMRRGEILKLRWRDINIEGRQIHVEAFNTKTMRERFVPMTKRLAAELERLYLKPDREKHVEKEADSLVFGFTDTVKKSFAGACREAGVSGFRFHDARHTAITRMIDGGMPAEQAGRIAGHTNVTTTYRYVNPHQGSIEKAASILDAFNDGAERSGAVN